ncbi:uncharacterized protein LOC114169457 [Vigna unguiculata]|uniref:uncharacterized protein LOC114169457 n=1 Tax=Vigna unguiculata TaxID=3917 RepID=UPI001016CBF7|nr:uncharacterized protein LOC114169457 [Vigna unguiculata]
MASQDDSKIVAGNGDFNAPHNFLYLHPSENPAISLVSPVLESHNYHSWSKSFATALSAKNKSILWMDKSEDIWRDLKSRFFQGNLLHISELQSEASSLKQGNASMIEYFTKMRVLWDELDSFRPYLICNCSAKCSCDLAGISHQRKTEDHAMQFFRGLNEQYSNVTSHVLMMDPIPSISKIFSYVVQQERQIGGHNFFNGVEAKINSTTVTCSYCKKAGHTKSICYRKHGFPGSKNNDNKNTRYAKKVCSFCGRNGHIIENCYKKHGFPPRYKASNKNNVVNSVDTIQEAKNESGAEDQDFKLSQQQYQALMSLLKQKSGNGTDNVYVNQDKMSIKKIGIADLQSGLYILKGDKEAGCNLSSRVCNSTVSQNIWHMRLGHPSRQRMAILNKRHLGPMYYDFHER